MKIGKKKSAFGAVINLITVIVIVCAVVYVINKVLDFVEAEREPEITSTFISNRLEIASELTTAEMIYNGLIYYTDGKIPFLTKKAFLMTYCAEVKSGVDLSELDINVTQSTVKIIIPEVEVLDILVDPDTIKFYDEKSALFNWVEKEDVIDAMQVAKDDVTENANIDELVTKAREQTEVILEGLLKDAIGDRQLVISYK
ncbi:MAG: DUF4230 domain-containing protein [Anaerocolumna sp.]